MTRKIHIPCNRYCSRDVHIVTFFIKNIKPSIHLSLDHTLQNIKQEATKTYDLHLTVAERGQRVFFFFVSFSFFLSRFLFFCLVFFFLRVFLFLARFSVFLSRFPFFGVFSFFLAFFSFFVAFLFFLVTLEIAN